MERTEHFVYRRDGKVFFYKVGQEVYAYDPNGRNHGLPESGEPVIFLHALGGSGEMWDPTVQRMEQHLVCYVLDLPGHVHSDLPPRRYNIGDFSQAVVDVMDAIGLKQSNIIGFHTGAMIAVDLAIHHESRVKKLVLDGLPYWGAERGQVMWERAFLPAFTDKTSYHVAVQPLIPWEEAKAKEPTLTRERWEAMDAAARKVRLWYRLGHECTTTYDTEAAGPQVKVPTLLLYGEDDTMRRGEQRAREGIKHAVYKLVAGSPGGAYRMPEDLARYATEFLLGKN